MIETTAADFLSIIDIDVANLDQVPDGLHRIYCGLLDVLLVRGAFPPPAMARVVAALERGDHDFTLTPQEDPDIRKTQIMFFGDAMSHNFVDEHGPPIDRYLANAARWRDACRRVFAADDDYETRLSALFRSLSGGRAIEVPVYADGRSYCPSTIRMMPPGRGAPFHIDNYFDGVHGWRYLSATVDTTHPINFFAMLSPAEHGGEIEVFELRFNDPRASADPSVDKDPSGFAYRAFSMRTGDLFIFASGRFWHRVSPVAGMRPRWTIGGFLGFGTDDRTVYYWG